MALFLIIVAAVLLASWLSDRRRAEQDFWRNLNP